MDRSTDWPWSWEEEVAWKSDLEARDYDFLEDLIGNAVEDGATGLQDVPSPPHEQPTDDAILEEYSVTA